MKPPGAQAGHQVVSIFFFCLPWIPPKFQFFLSPFSWIPPKIQTIIHEYQVTKIKKYERFTMKSSIGDFGQNFSTSNLQYIKCEFKLHQEISSIYNIVSLTLCQKKRYAFFNLYSVHNIKIDFLFSVPGWFYILDIIILGFTQLLKLFLKNLL